MSFSRAERFQQDSILSLLQYTIEILPERDHFFVLQLSSGELACVFLDHVVDCIGGRYVLLIAPSGSVGTPISDGPISAERGMMPRITR